ncbi:MAG: THUMP domain-containing protein [Candidatus Heimdallarchaeota archaeon]|nr:THUMP domain-containing protein [Candidatus Heimdallarchaeota archaeon]
MEIVDACKENAQFLLVGCEAVRERDAMSEMYHALVKYCQTTPLEAFTLPIRGLFLIAIKNDLHDILSKLRKITDDELFTFKVCRKITPLERVVKSTLKEMMGKLPEFLLRVPGNKKWRITVNRRHTLLKKTEIIGAIAEHPNAPKGKVDLENPEWDIIIEVFGEWLGFSVMPSSPIVYLPEDKESIVGINEEDDLF